MASLPSPDRPLAYLADLTHTGAGLHAYGFPLGVGLVAAYAMQEIPSLTCRVFKLPDDLVSALDDSPPHILGLSNFVWNINLACLVAAYAKKLYPDLIVVLGGPNFPQDQESRQAFLEQRPEIDFYLRWDGEYAFTRLVETLGEYRFDAAAAKASGFATENCSYLRDGMYIEGPDHRMVDVTTLPSPYTSGLLDRFFDKALIPMIETTRGCPYACTFCNDGSPIRSKVYRRAEKDIAADLDYIAQRATKTTQLTIADLNFGQYREDLITSRLIAETIQRHNWPDRVESAVGKAQPARILECVDIINAAKPGTMKFGASFQSTDPTVLKALKRLNVPFEKLLELETLNSGSASEALEYHTELILCLPEDSLERHYNTLADVIDTLGMNDIVVYQLIVLDGTEMAVPEFCDQYSFDVRHRLYVGCIGNYKLGDEIVPCAEIENVVVANNTMPFADYIECRIMDLLVKIFVDKESFREIFEFVKNRGFSQFALLRHLRENVIGNYPRLDALLDDFTRDNTAWMFENRDELIKFSADPEVIEKYISGEYGKNEMLHYRAVAYLEFGDEIHSALRDAAISFLRDRNNLDSATEDYLNEAAIYSKLRKFDPHAVEETKTHPFTFDFAAATRDTFKNEPQGWRVAAHEVSFSHDPETVDRLHRMMKTWSSQGESQISKMFQKVNLMLLDRRAEIIETSIAAAAQNESRPADAPN